MLQSLRLRIGPVTKGREFWTRRKALGWSQAELAKQAHVSRDTVWRIEHDVGRGDTTLWAVEAALTEGERQRDLRRHGTHLASRGPSQGGSDVAAAGVFQIDAGTFHELEDVATRLNRLLGRIEGGRIVVSADSDSATPSTGRKPPRKHAARSR